MSIGKKFGAVAVGTITAGLWVTGKSIKYGTKLLGHALNESANNIDKKHKGAFVTRDGRTITSQDCRKGAAMCGNESAQRKICRENGEKFEKKEHATEKYCGDSLDDFCKKGIKLAAGLWNDED